MNEYLRIADIPVSKVVFDGYVADPKSWNDKLAGKGKQIIAGYLLDGKDSFEETHAKIPITLSPNGA